MTPTKVIPREKLSKRKKRELAAKQRGSWGGLNPVTRKPPKSGSYQRGKAKKACREEILQAFSSPFRVEY